MSCDAQPLRPLPGERGLASGGPERLTPLVLDAWDSFLTLAETLELDAPSRCPGWTARELLAHLGSWPQHRLLADALADAQVAALADARAEALGDARAEALGDRPSWSTRSIDQQERNARIVAQHGREPRDVIMDALRAARTETATTLAAESTAELGTTPVPTMLGALPLLGLVAALGYELAVHAMDLAPCGAAVTLPAPLATAGLAALADVTGALAARNGLAVTFAVSTPSSCWATGTAEGSWTTAAIGGGALPHPVHWPAIIGSAEVVLDVSAGRAPVPQMLLTRQLRLQNVTGLLELATVLDDVPSLPGGAALRAAARYLGGVGRLLRRLPGVS